jgi:signal transduction histidine kinase/ActR/RegA family two-component response regulator
MAETIGEQAARILQLELRMHVLSSSLRAFSEATTDYERLLGVIAQRLAEVVKDGCVVRLLEPGGWLLPVAIHMPIESRVSDPEVLAKIRAHMAIRHHVSEQSAARQVIETGEAVLVPRLDLGELRARATPEIADTFATIGIHSLLFVALRVRGQSLGLLALVRFASESSPFTEEDQALAQALADHAALAIANARLLKSALSDLAERERAVALLRKTEEQLRHAQKMEAIGRLAGSIAHDFNNLLSVILGHGSFMLEDLKQTDPMRDEIAAIMRAGDRAAQLTHQLLAFSRQQVIMPRVLDLNVVLRESEKMLRRLLGEDIELVTRYDRNLVKVRVDPAQIDQIVMNLAVNARDAMPNGGKLTIETSDVVLDESYASEHFEVLPGPHAMLAVSDTGIGMTKEVQMRIYEPFFTTKEKGKGTGLGLSTIFGIVKQSGGNIWVYSEPNEGTTFRIYFPKAGDVEDPVVETPPTPVLTGSETILLAEDQDDVRFVASESLRRYGYHVLEAKNGGEALLICEQHPLPIQLLLTDVVMPRMNGRELALRLLELRPDLRILYMSGYTDNAIVHHGILEPDVAYVQKPMVPETLARRVREVLDSPRRTHPPRA